MAKKIKDAGKDLPTRAEVLDAMIKKMYSDMGREEKEITPEIREAEMLEELQKLQDSDNPFDKNTAIQYGIEMVGQQLTDFKRLKETSINPIVKARWTESIRMYEDFLNRLRSSLSNYFSDGAVPSIFPSLTWTKKSDLSELIYCLAKSERIRQDGKPVSQEELIKVFSNLFNVDLTNHHKLLDNRSRTQKREDGTSFISELMSHLEK